MRPGGGFEFKGELFAKVEVNGSGRHPLWAWLTDAIRVPEGGDSDMMYSAADRVVWGPVRRSDVEWNFTTWIVGKDGKPRRRFYKGVPSDHESVRAAIDELLAE